MKKFKNILTRNKTKNKIILKMNLYKNLSPTTPTTPDSDIKNKPIQGGFDSLWLLVLAYFTKSTEYGQILLPFDPIIVTKADPFFFNMCLLYLNVCEFCIILAVFLLAMSLIAISIFIYNKSPNLKSYFSKKENALWAVLCFNIIPTLLIIKLIFNPYSDRFYKLINSFIIFINSGSFPYYYYYNPPGLAMGSSRVLHPADYSQIVTTLNLQYINPEYILHVVTVIQYCAISVIVYIVYFIIAVVTSGIYTKDKWALSIQGEPTSCNFFTKYFYFKSPQARVKSVLVFFGIVLILMTLASIILYHYIYMYKIG
jgi:hypothetical protein